MRIEIWNHTKFEKDSKIVWPCPACDVENLSLVKDKFHSFESADTKIFKNELEWEYEWNSYNFTGVLLCGNCKNETLVTGHGTVKHYAFCDQVSNDYIEGYDFQYHPAFFQPTLNIFKIPENCPDLVQLEIKNSFRHFWIDNSSCANKIRVALELLMNELKVAKTNINKGKRRKLSLHERIIAYKSKNVEIGTYLEAIKWIGNSGSHVGNLGKVDILDAYKILEFGLNKLYDNPEKELMKISSEIIARKGKRKQK